MYFLLNNFPAETFNSPGKHFFYSPRANEISEIIPILFRKYKGDLQVRLVSNQIYAVITPDYELRSIAWLFPGEHFETVEELAAKADVFFGLYGRNASTLATAAYKRLLKITGCKSPHTGEHYYKRMKRFYFAGRVEAPDLGKHTDLKYYDINSAFPRAMIEEHAWGGYFFATTKIPKKYINQSFFQIKARSTGAFPFKKEDGTIYFPNDNEVREFNVTGWEYSTAKELGLLEVVEIIEILVPYRVQNFKKYVETVYAEKLAAEKSGDTTGRQFAKWFLNSSYGKLGQNPSNFKEVRVMAWSDRPDKSWSCVYTDVQAGLSYWERPAKSYAYHDVAVAASITGWVRAFMLRSIKGCTGFVYCDTDAIVCKDPGAIKIGDKLGEWKLEMNVKEMWIAGKKMYSAFDGKKWKTASKGVVLNNADIKKLCKGKEVKYIQKELSISWTGRTEKIIRRINKN